jgi:hypothetical protein
LITIPNYDGLDTLRARGLRLTRPRRLILDVVRATELSAVHFVRFALPPEARERFATSEVALVVEHPNEDSRTVLSDETKRSLEGDLA